jgi:DNA-binding transcriptional LysR family regulator
LTTALAPRFRGTTARQAPTRPDANALELFARIVIAGSFAQAARELNLTRAAISRRVASIEAELGVALFTRSTRALGLTQAGRRLAVRARAVHDAADSARRGLASSTRAQLGGTLRVTSVPMFANAVLAPLLARFQREHPELQIELRLTGRALDLLREDVDVAFRMTAKPPQDWIAQPVLPFAVHAYAAPGPGLPLARPQDLASSRCLVFGSPMGPQTLHWKFKAPRQRSASAAVPIEPALVADDLNTLLAVARAGGGIVFAPDFSVTADLAVGALINALPGWHLPVELGDSVQALTLPLSVAPESARALVNFVRQALAQQSAR